jgi:hypothetical protein
MMAKQLYRLDTNPYTFNNPGSEVPQIYEPRDNIAAMLLSPELKLDAKQALLAHVLAMRVLVEPSPILLDADEYQRITRARDALKGFSWADIGLLERIRDAELVEVQEC